MMFPVMKNEKKLHWVKLAVGAFLLALLGTGCIADSITNIDDRKVPARETDAPPYSVMF